MFVGELIAEMDADIGFGHPAGTEPSGLLQTVIGNFLVF
jgi:hypothetical protein